MLRMETGTMNNTDHNRCSFCGDETNVAVSEQTGLACRICGSCCQWALEQLCQRSVNLKPSETRVVGIKTSDTRRIDPDRIRMGLGAEPSPMPSVAKRFRPATVRSK